MACLPSGGKCPGCARSSRRQIRNAIPQVDSGSDPRVAKLDVSICIFAGGQERSSVSAKEHIVFICVESVPHQLRDKEARNQIVKWPSGSNYTVIALAGGRQGSIPSARLPTCNVTQSARS